MPELNYFCVENISGMPNSIWFKSIYANNLAEIPVIEYSIDDGITWQNYIFASTSDTDGQKIFLSNNQKCYFRGNNNYFNGSPWYWTNNNNFRLASANIFNISGNIMSLLDKTCEKTDIPTNYCFAGLFSYSKVVDASNLILAAHTLSEYCYSAMFENCKVLTGAPVLSATNLADSCYWRMFSGCALLKNAPALPALKLANRCYGSMFSSCTSLLNPPTLPATTLVNECYEQMFENCTSLINKINFPAKNLAYRCYSGTFSGTNILPDTSNIDFYNLSNQSCVGLFAGTNVTYEDLYNLLPVINGKPTLPASLSSTGYCYSNMFSSCKKLIAGPVLPAKKLTFGCYDSMFAYCENLRYLPEIGATTYADNCCNYMFQGCKKLKLSNTKTDNTPIPFILTDDSGKSLSNPTNNMFSQIANIDVTPALNTLYYAKFVQNVYNNAYIFTSISPLPSRTIKINFISDNTYFSTFSYRIENGKANLYYDNTLAAKSKNEYLSNVTWVKKEYKTIYICNGVDVCNIDFIEWLSNNAISAYPQPVVKIGLHSYAKDHNISLGEYDIKAKLIKNNAIDSDWTGSVKYRLTSLIDHNIGNDSIVDFKFGNIGIKKIYFGNNLIYNSEDKLQALPPHISLYNNRYVLLDNTANYNVYADGAKVDKINSED